MNAVRNSKASKAVSMSLAIVFLFLTVNPSISYALSTGPGQPELEGFTPIGVDNMVDSFSGDFNYNLPLLTVPGPDGGYPINLSYSAGVGMEQEASWVGLGWSLNPGAINREVRGLPDDFNGQKVKKKLTNKPNQTLSLGLAATDIEALGIDLKKVFTGSLKLGGNLTLSYNNYKGFDVQAGLGFSLKEAEESAGAGSAESTEVIDPDDGTKNVELSYSDHLTKNKASGSKGESLQGPKIDFSSYFKNLGSKALHNENLLGFANAKTVSDIDFDHPRLNHSYGFDVKTGFSLIGITGDLRVDVFFSEQKLQTKEIDLPAYGYLYSENNFKNENLGLMDFTRDNRSVLTPDSRILPVPNMTNDIYHVSAQGMSGKVRPYRSGVSILTDPNTYSRTGNGGAGFELNGGATEVKGGANFRLSYAESYSGPWQSGTEAINFLKTDAEETQGRFPLAEPYFFRFANELTAQANQGTIHTDSRASRLGMSTMFEEYNAHPQLQNRLSTSRTSSLTPTTAYRSQRERRSKMFTMLTDKEAAQYNPFSRTVKDITGTNDITVARISSDTDPRSKATGEIHVTDEQGKQFIYGIPAKNKVQKQNVFSVSHTSNGTSSPVPKLVGYSSTQNSLNNASGKDHFYSSTETPEHAHSYLLTEVLSPDYVDLSGNGPTRDDFGSYTKFNYKVDRNFKTKAPLTGGNYLPGKLSDATDDKAAITYYEKDLYYLHTIETKTHIAVFELGDRSDGRGVTNENDNNASSGADGTLKRLKRITLYNVEDYVANAASAKAIKTVNFDYDYELCPLTPNSNATGGGKLTLKSIWYSIGSERTKMSLSPYQFFYSSENPSYDTEAIDRWASYQPVSDNPFRSNVLYPYAQQVKTKADQFASAWNLTRIKLPTGGEITVQYEADDYQFVQDQRAQQMYRLAGFLPSKSSTQIGAALLDEDDTQGGAIWAVINLPHEIASDQVGAYFRGIDHAYFKAFVRYKNHVQSTKPSAPFNASNIAYDFVEGYLEFASTGELFPQGRAFSDKIMVRVKELGNNNPIKKAGWVEMKLNRNDLLDDSNFDLTHFNKIDASMLKTVKQVLSAALNFSEGDPFFTEAERKGYCNQLGSALPSIIRLNAPHAKLGGGHRVKEIAITDNWRHSGESAARAYGQKYYYEYENGESSGVAQYEPSTGGEENPFRKPERYSSDRILLKDDYLYTELPLGESFYPSASVGYARVKRVNTANEVVTASGAGIEVSEYYTARDYPVLTEKTDPQKVNTGELNKVLRFLGAKNFFEPGFSQGYKIEMNDMHGKLKSTATYSAYPDKAKEGPVRKTEYFYKTKGGQYKAGKKNHLDNFSSLYYGDGLAGEGEVGVMQDTYLDVKETHTRSIGGAVDVNLSTIMLLFVPLILPSAVPNLDYSYSMTRTAVLNKIVERTGILEKVVTTERNAETSVENLAYDYETGEPVMTASTNQYGNKVYNYDQKAKWYYESMGGAYRNTGLFISDDLNVLLTGQLQTGDVLLSKSGSKAWVTGTAPLTVVNENNATVHNLKGYKVIKSGYKNDLRTSAGYIQSLADLRDSSFAIAILEDCMAQVSSMSFDSTDIRDPGYTVISPEGHQKQHVHLYDAPKPKYFYDRTGNPVSSTVVDCHNPSGIQLTYEYYAQPYWASSPPTYQFGATVSDTVVITKHIAAGLTHEIWIKNDSQTFFNFTSCPNSDAIYIKFRTPLEYDVQDFKLHFLGGNQFLAVHRNGEVFKGTGYLADHTTCYGFGDFFKPCVVIPTLNSAATTFSDQLKYNGDLPGGITAAAITANPAKYGYKGLYKPQGEYFTPKKRIPEFATPHRFPTNISKDGEYESFLPFNHFDQNLLWRKSKEVKMYDYNGTPVEEQNAIGNYSSVLYGYSRTLPIAVAQNARYTEISYDGFEDHGTSYDDTKKDNHMNFGANVVLSSEWDGHTGRYSVQVNAAEATADLELVDGKDYIIQAWHKVGSGGTLKAYNGANANASTISPSIEGWELVEVKFTASSVNRIKLNGNGSQFDDIRILPFSAGMKSYVYDKYTHKLIATLDENNFATFYNYDRDQVLVQIKKETERGIKTIQSTQRVTNQQASLN